MFRVRFADGAEATPFILIRKHLKQKELYIEAWPFHREQPAHVGLDEPDELLWEYARKNLEMFNRVRRPYDQVEILPWIKKPKSNKMFILR